MRPTFQEKDRLVVSKTQFGLNIPLRPSHFYFNPVSVKRSGIVVFTGENMDIHDVDVKYFYIFPGKKQLIKRMIGKPGDTLYFYGGQIYGIDEFGNDISSELQVPQLDYVNHIPFISFEGKVVTPMPPVNGVYTPVFLYQMNLPVAKMSLSPFKQIDAELLYPPKTTNHYSYADMWGFKNYATTRIVTKKHISKSTYQELPKSTYYLELTHNPSLKTAKMGRDAYYRARPMLGTSTSYIPLSEKKLKQVFSSLFTGRFIVKNGLARRLGSPPINNQTKHIFPYLPGIADGTYEFYKGQAYKVYPQGITKKLPAENPLCQFDVDRVITLYNIGIEFDNRFTPDDEAFAVTPARYSYFKDHDLYLMGAPIFTKNEPELINFIKVEYEKQSRSTKRAPYVAFDDNGPPLNPDGSLNTTMIQRFGIKVPDKHYLVLGDNYAMSADSRDFGFVPEDNIRGVPEFIFWPPGSRFGFPIQPHYALFTKPRLIVWAIALIVFILWGIWHKKTYGLPIDFKK